MITIRFPSGLSLQYNNVKFIDWRTNMAYLQVEQGKEKSYSVAVNLNTVAVIEYEAPCRTYNCMSDPDGKLAGALDSITKIQRKITKLSTAERKRRQSK